ncbi:SDR family NAD(P)-dependent oxidoreductase [Roseomonas elaeocarpi]|uniref:SDR family NAD(P)-dependent oxidoreductase n=1 Tax=Roseomonas elaeocarpi TaxID=907779 RepID=A0ABV6JSY9_9PROT
MQFRDKRVVITGAGGIFGGWIAEAFAAEGARLLLSDNRPEAVDALVSRLGPNAAPVLRHRTELTDAASIEDLAAFTAREWGAPDFVVNNAGIYPRSGPLLELDVADWDRLMDVNFRAPFILTREMAKLMIREKVEGSIVNIGSGAARKMNLGSVPYCTSKTALERLSKGLALELAQHRIRVNVVEPGFAPGSDVSLLPPGYAEDMIARIPLNRASGPGDAPRAVLYLCSEAASFITGAVLSVDGGNSIGTYQRPK